MKIRLIRYSKTKNIGNYESVRVEAEAEVDDNEDPTAVFEDLKKWVLEQTSTDHDE